MRNESFICLNCHKEVSPHPEGSARNHCPNCLASLHVDQDFPGDRASECRGIMKTTSLDYSGKKGHILIQQCTQCSHQHRNKCAPDDDIVGFLKKQSSLSPALYE